MSKAHLTETITISSEEALKNAVKVGYGKIYIQGEYANRIANKPGKYSVGNKFSNLSLVIGCFFVPLFFVGVAGKILTKDMKKYEVVSVAESEVCIQHKAYKE